MSKCSPKAALSTCLLAAVTLVAACSGSIGEDGSTSLALSRPTGCGIMRAGEGLRRGDVLKSCNGRFSIALQTDSNLVLYDTSVPIIATNTAGRNAAMLMMQVDGNLVLYDTMSQALWSTGTSGNPGAYLALQDDGNVVIRAASGAALWVSNTVAGSCPGLAACRDQAVDCSARIQSCIDATPAGGVVELAAGRYSLARPIEIAKPMTLRTKGSAGAPPCAPEGPGCAELVALPELAQPFGLLVVKAAAAVDHIVIDGNRLARAGGPAAASCIAGNTSPGFNAAYFCSSCAFTNSVSRNAVCGTGLQIAKGNKITVTRSTFAGNGRHNQKMLWADGLTVHDAADSTFNDNTFIDNTDVDLIFGGCERCRIQNNTIRHTADTAGGSFVALMIHKWPTTSGSYANVDVSGNRVDCGPARACGSGLYIASESWYPETPFGSQAPGQVSGAIHDNTVVNAMNGVYVAARGLAIYRNGVLNAHGVPIPSSCGKTLVSATPYVISPTAASIDFAGENVDEKMKVHFSSANWSGCVPNWPF